MENNISNVCQTGKGLVLVWRFSSLETTAEGFPLKVPAAHQNYPTFLQFTYTTLWLKHDPLYHRLTGLPNHSFQSKNDVIIQPHTGGFSFTGPLKQDLERDEDTYVNCAVLVKFIDDAFGCNIHTILTWQMYRFRPCSVVGASVTNRCPTSELV